MQRRYGELHTGVLTEEDCQKAFNLLHRIAGRKLVLDPELKYLGEALKVSLTYGITVDDALYVALALRRNLPLLTLDEKQKKAAAEPGIHMKP